MSSNVAIQVESLSKCYHVYDQPFDRLKQSIYPGMQRLFGLPQRSYSKDFWALQNVSFQVETGETLGIVGRNGSGKSTLLQLICRTLNPTHGDIRTRGRIAALLELGTGFNPEFTGRENVYLNAALFGLKKEEVDERFDEIAAFADIGDFIEQPIRTYSNGMYVRLAFAIIAHVDADILIIDEALAVGDAIFVLKCMSFIRKFREKGTLLFVSHNTQAILDLCDRAIWLDEGNMKMDGLAKDISSTYSAFVHGKVTSEELIRKEAKKRSVSDRVETTVDDEMVYSTTEAVYSKLSETLPNIINLFNYDKETPWWGKGGAEINNITLENHRGEKLLELKGGQEIKIVVECRATDKINNPIIGFSFRNSRGMELFSDNTYLFVKKPPTIEPGDHFRAVFQFFLPFLAPGDYAIGAAIADGSQDQFIQLQRQDDSVMVKVTSSHVVFGVVGFPMKDCYIDKQSELKRLTV